jgi:hypothetical protein
VHAFRDFARGVFPLAESVIYAKVAWIALDPGASG